MAGETMEAKCKELLQILVNAEGRMTSRELACHLNVSSRTVRNYIGVINSEHKNLIKSSNKGYILDRGRAKKLITESTLSIPVTQDDRVLFILKRLVQTGSIDIYDISEALMVSPETIKKDLSLVKEKLINNNLFVNQKNGTLIIDGAERDKRLLLGKLLSGEFNNGLLNVEVLEDLFPDFDLVSLKNTIKDICEKHGYFVNDYALLNLVLEIAIELDRIEHDFMQSERHIYLSDFSSDELSLVNELAARIESDYNVSYSDSERKALANIVLGNLTKIDYSSLSSEGLKDVLDSKTIKLILELKTEMRKWNLFDVDNDTFIVKFSLHIKNLLVRLEGDYELNNPLTKQIKHSCPLIFEHAVELANAISKFTGKKVGEDESTFLALHIGSIMGESDYLNNHIKCVFYVPSYYDFSQGLIGKIEKVFGKDLVVSQVVSAVDDIDTNNNDVLINVGPLLYNTSLYEVQITPFFTKNDERTIQNAIEKNRVLKRQNYLRDHLNELTEPGLFFKVMDKSKSDVLRFMCNNLIKKRYVHQNFYNDVLERESQSATAFGRVAVPHSFNMDAEKTSLEIVLSEKGIKWDKDNTVNIVLLFAIKKEERAIFFNIFDSIVTGLMDPKLIRSVSESHSLDEFIEKFISHFLSS